MKDKNEILTELFNSQFMTDIIRKITSGHRLGEDLKQELFLILCEMKSDKIINAYDDNWLNYLVMNILKKQFHSSTSPFHKKWRKGFGDNEIPDIEDIQVEGMNWDLIERIEKIANEKLDFVDCELFKMYYKFGHYDRWFGELRDTNCEKQMSSYRKMAKKLKLDKGDVTISRSTISLSIQRSIMIIKNELLKYGIDY